MTSLLNLKLSPNVQCISFVMPSFDSMGNYGQLPKRLDEWSERFESLIYARLSTSDFNWERGFVPDKIYERGIPVEAFWSS